MGESVKDARVTTDSVLVAHQKGVARFDLDQAQNEPAFEYRIAEDGPSEITTVHQFIDRNYFLIGFRYDDDEVTSESKTRPAMEIRQYGKSEAKTFTKTFTGISHGKSVVASMDDRYIVSGMEDVKKVYLWNNLGHLKHIMDVPSPLTCVTLINKIKDWEIVAGCLDGTVLKICHLFKSWRKSILLEGNGQPIECMHSCRGSSQVAVASSNGIRIFDGKHGKETFRCERHKNARRICLNPVTTSLVAIADVHGSVFVVDYQKDVSLIVHDAPRGKSGGTEKAVHVSWHPDDGTLWVVFADGCIKEYVMPTDTLS
uniref:Anaphase-promoting complex subunit 4 WD40 domain-containing protein n=1 Tax=Lotharella globosa TaxID=91324 RepID=A0A7S3ZA45_9EUKA|eukprot:CAMPEP_0167811212 /NCGR_PEP_ID=MMETSP0112_2-20121227/537_1 /TAXON_ID=91324 /ORGANISM="Lotharella globosa, Strain CCCM811" /LENGTH=313 /DNA_ID=CAMNT_0007709887 /DNA_START=135 /DNA_END=1076 /DNA_ORIENTATION=-